MNEVLSVANLDFSYRNEKLLRNINFNINEGDFVGITGANGSGKSTLLKLILGFLKPDKGEINFIGGKKDFTIGYVPQNNHEKSISFPITAYEIVSMNVRADGENSSDEKIENALSLVEMNDKKYYDYNKMSGGEQERVMIAKALANEPKILIFDEPTAGLDQESKENLFRLLKHLNSHHKITILVVTHELEFTRDYFNRIFRLESEFVEVKNV
ncbi:metal ABC transporter ATP-binding protein [uncultured Finegoldia sp.]|uniref:metal ABC transporter ATP-binding protein n=1 Tax=uncultured Finegoldia sp. TaxID=328009 RepID=UPI002621DAA7|nr:metal ABC transporter ATP-binding protein [uncultured Finegoldia sp.]